MTESINFYDGKEEHGIIIDWQKVFRKYHQIMRSCKAPLELFDPSTAPVNEAKYFVYMSERASGKTTNWLLIGMILFEMYGIQTQYIRQTDDMIKPSICGEIFNVILTFHAGRYIKEITSNRYCGVYIHWKKAYFCNYDDNGKPDNIAPEPFLSFLSIDQNMNYKSGYNAPRGDLILFDEFIGNTYRINEFVDFIDLCSTIIRKRKSPIIVMMSNTINYNSTYFHELEISREVKKLKVGQNRLIETEKGTKVYCELIGLKPSAIKSQINRLFYGFKNPRLAAITGGEQTWSFNPVPHIVHEENEEVLNKSLRIDCGDIFLQVEVLETESRGLICNVHESSRKIFDDTIILTNGDITSREQMFGIGKGSLCKLVWKLYSENKWYFDTNETGSMVENYVNTYRQIRK
jgi:hypothetical protein